jgi:hypothetical protein
LVEGKLINILLFGVGTTALEGGRLDHVLLQHVRSRSRVRSTAGGTACGRIWLNSSLENCGVFNMFMYVLS